MNSKAVENIVFILLILLVFFIIVPIIPLILWSFSGGWKWPEIFPNIFAMRAWKYVFSVSSRTGKAVLTSLNITFIVTIINIIIGIPAANALGRYEFKGKKITEGILLTPVIIPPIVAAIGMHKMFIHLDLVDTMEGVVLTHTISTLPYMIKALSISFKNLGFNLEEQAKMLGAGYINRFFYVVFPYLLPGIAAGSSLTVLISLSQYIITVLIGGGQIMTLPMLMVPFINGGDQSIGAVYCIIFAVLAFILLWFMDNILKKYYGNKRIN
ncbi:ABC transporter permease [Clostridium sp. ZS2-4]|uniref:ABC transporter permease n=1 Tax=Clostridium sp. ZS2-4 TaxID=2987703 RepID=UPI00227A3C6A|nr:ABC transporter permease subunit [Clostridium sp. ZS2-4]MCY6355769.1 ABC transporter permease subunit [Clostridium sp. ZS2-4]